MPPQHVCRFVYIRCGLCHVWAILQRECFKPLDRFRVLNTHVEQAHSKPTPAVMTPPNQRHGRKQLSLISQTNCVRDYDQATAAECMMISRSHRGTTHCEVYEAGAWKASWVDGVHTVGFAHSWWWLSSIVVSSFECAGYCTHVLCSRVHLGAWITKALVSLSGDTHPTPSHTSLLPSTHVP